MGKKYVVPQEMQPEVGMHEIVDVDGGRRIVRNDSMFTGYQVSMAEFSDFFIMVRDECKLIGHWCPSCSHIICPPYQTHCPSCSFTKLIPVKLSDRGFMAASPVIVMFAPANFKDEAPYTIGYVFMYNNNVDCTHSAMLVRCRTTQGMMRPGIYKKGTEVKVVFRDERVGSVRDFFVVPMSELTQVQRKKTPLMESDIDWGKVVEPSFGKPSPQDESKHYELKSALEKFVERIAQSPRARADLANWHRFVIIKTRTGAFDFSINDGRVTVYKQNLMPKDQCVTMCVDDPRELLKWLNGDVALTNLVMEGAVWLSKPDIETITRLDRVIRSLRRNNV